LRTHVSDLFRFAWIARNLVFARAFADNHADVSRVARFDHQPAAFLHHVESISHGFTASHAHERPVLARYDLTTIRPVLMKEMAHHAEAASLIHQIGFESD